MEFTEEHSKRLLVKEWLAKSDSSTSTPYLLKFDSLTSDLSCCVLLTDTKSVWTEVLTSKQLARRWRSLNQLSPEPTSDSAGEDAWREHTLELLSNAHAIGGFGELSFQIVESQYSDIACEIECDAFKWRWEATFLGYKVSSEIISRHLIFPLISLNHLTLSASEPMGGLPDTELEKAVDKIGRTARRTVDTHIKNALSKPRVATTIRRMTAIFNFVSDLPPVRSTVEKAQLQAEKVEPKTTSPSPNLAKRLREPSSDSSPKLVHERHSDKLERTWSVDMKPIQPDSATESDADEPINVSKPVSLANVAGPSKTSSASQQSPKSQTPPVATKAPAEPTSDSESSPHRPVKKAKSKALVSSDEDSEDERKKRVAQLKSGTAAGGAKTRGTKQPLRRGGKRF